MKASQISTLINEIWDGVERSKVGKIIEEVPISKEFPEGKKIHVLPMNTFLYLLNSLTPKSFDGMMGIREKL